MTNQQLWQSVLGELEIILSKANFTTWFKKTFICEATDDGLVIGVPNTFTKSWLEKKYHRDIAKIIDELTHGQYRRIEYRVVTTRPVEVGGEVVTATPLDGVVPSVNNDIIVAAPSVATVADDAPLVGQNGLSSRYTFTSFIVGKTNELAHAAAQAVSQAPGKAYNPFFIYGGVGLGKTHLMQAIGHKILEVYPTKKVLYLNSETFTNEFIRSIQGGRIDDFKKRYRTIDALLIDDIQFLAGKEGTQEEFFHTFNALHQAGKQIVVASDRPPKAIPALEERLVSRFEWGLIADIGSPDYETRLAILKAKCKEKRVSFDEDVVSFVATNIYSNIRELEGALNKILAFVDINNMDPTLANVKKVLASWTTSGDKSRSVTTKNILTTICDFYDLPLSELIGSCREKRLVVPRQIAMYLMRTELKSSFPGIGQEMGGRDHTTAMHACTKIGKEIERDEKIRQDISHIKQRLYN